MTVAAVILAAAPDSALADADGTPAVRRLVDAAWAGGATPVLVRAPDPEGAVARALANAEVTLIDPADPELEPVARIVDGMEAAARLVTETEAALIWPARLAWVDAETVTTLIAAHGEDRTAVIRAAWGVQPGWPVLIPIRHLDALRAFADRTSQPDDASDGLFAGLTSAGVPIRVVDSGDPGVVHDISVTRADLPPFDGPPQPADPHAHEWGAAAADQPDDAPLEEPDRRPSG